MTRHRIISALGVAIVALPAVDPAGAVADRWLVACIGKNGRWQCIIPCDSAQAAKNKRAKLFRWHRTLAKKEGRK